jgi:hypothetical protein
MKLPHMFCIMASHAGAAARAKFIMIFQGYLMTAQTITETRSLVICRNNAGRWQCKKQGGYNNGSHNGQNQSRNRPPYCSSDAELQFPVYPKSNPSSK